MSDQHDDIRQDIVTCTRLLVMQGILDYSGHLSGRIPGTDHILIQPRDTSRSALRPEDMLVIDLEGNVIEGDGIPVAEWPIHAGVYRARADVAFVCHGHPTLSTTFTMVDQKLLPMRHFAFGFPDGLAVHPDPTHIRSLEQGDALAATLADAGACLIRSHGTLVVADRIQNLFMHCMDLEENARTMLYATQLGPLLPLTEQECIDVGASYGKLGHRSGKMWEHYLHKGRTVGVI